MSFSISVKIPHASQPKPNDPNELDEWLNEEQQYVIYDEAVAADGIVADFWCKPSVKMGLKIIPKIYSEGFESSDARELSQLLVGLEALEQFWKTNLDDSEWIKEGNFVKELLERSNNVRQAIQLAKTEAALLTIS
jgi:hypothetical protein